MTKTYRYVMEKIKKLHPTDGKTNYVGTTRSYSGLE
jgi:hypothetical protein